MCLAQGLFLDFTEYGGSKGVEPWVGTCKIVPAHSYHTKDTGTRSCFHVQQDKHKLTSISTYESIIIGHSKLFPSYYMQEWVIHFTFTKSVHSCL